MRAVLLRILPLALVAIAISSHAHPAKETAPAANSGDSPPKGAVHLVINSDAEARKIFTYFRYPGNVFAVHWSGALITGVYRLEVNPQGAVSAVAIVKSMGRATDATAMKTFVRWRARPGPVRLVDVHCEIPTTRFHYAHPY